MKYLKANKAQMVAMSMIGHYVYAALKESGVQTWIHDVSNTADHLSHPLHRCPREAVGALTFMLLRQLPDPLKEVMVKLLGWGWFQSRIAEFNLHEIDAKLFAKISDVTLGPSNPSPHILMSTALCALPRKHDASVPGIPPWRTGGFQVEASDFTSRASLMRTVVC